MQEIVNKAGATEAQAKPRLVPVSKWNLEHAWPSIAGLRWLIFNAEHNGFGSVIKRAGGRVLIDEAAFFDWVEAQNEKAKIA